jgi:SAM-dependent methyltransferase
MSEAIKLTEIREADIRPAEMHEEYLRLSATDGDTYFRNGAQQPVPCPGCGGNDSVLSFVKRGFDYMECSICGTLFQSPRASIEVFKRFYSESPSSRYWAEVFFPSVAEVRREKLFRPRVERILEVCSKKDFSPRTVVDVGAGCGIFLEEWNRRCPEVRVVAVEPSPKSAMICRSKGLEVVEEMAENVDKLNESADLVTCFEVIEHVYDTLFFVQSLAKLVRKGGYAVVTGLGCEGFDIQTLWEKSRSIWPPHHINFLSLAGFEALFKRAGFSGVELLTPGELDVDIVANMIANAKNSPLGGRFAATLLKRGQGARSDFQAFLRDHKLSSHVWVVAKK